MKKRSILILALCATALFAALLSACGKTDDPAPSAIPTMPAALDDAGKAAWMQAMMQRMGEAQKQYEAEKASGDDKVVARYGDFTVTQADIHYHQALALAGVGTERTVDAREIAERLVGSRLALAEAEQQGLAATEAEIQEYVQSNRTTYETYPEAREPIDALLAGSGQTLEEYFQGIEDQAYDTMTLNRFKNQFYEQWEAEHPFVEPKNQDDYMKAIEEWRAGKEDAYDDYLTALVKQHKSEIEFYI